MIKVTVEKQTILKALYAKRNRIVVAHAKKKNALPKKVEKALVAALAKVRNGKWPTTRTSIQLGGGAYLNLPHLSAQPDTRLVEGKIAFYEAATETEFRLTEDDARSLFDPTTPF